MTIDRKECSRCHNLKYHFQTDVVCWDCQTDDKNRKISYEVAKKGESNSEKDIFCPYCGYLNSDDEFYESGKMTCYECEKDFNVEVEYTITYSTSK